MFTVDHATVEYKLNDIPMCWNSLCAFGTISVFVYYRQYSYQMSDALHCLLKEKKSISP